MVTPHPKRMETGLRQRVPRRKGQREGQQRLQKHSYKPTHDTDLHDGNIRLALQNLVDMGKEKFLSGDRSLSEAQVDAAMDDLSELRKAVREIPGGDKREAAEQRLRALELAFGKRTL